MGVALYVKSFSKNENTVLNELKSLGFYDANENVIEKFKSDEIVIHDFDIIDTLISSGKLSSFLDYGIFLPIRELGFYLFLVDPMNGLGYTSEGGYEYSIAHDPQHIISTVEKLIRICGEWDKSFHGPINLDSNLKSLIQIQSFLNSSIERGDLVSFVIG